MVPPQNRPEDKRPRKKKGYLAGQLLIATPNIQFSCFEKSVILMCLHNDDGAMGIIINHEIEDVSVRDVFTHFDIHSDHGLVELPVHFGGPVDTNVGFVLHSQDYMTKGTVMVTETLSMTSNRKVLEDIASGCGPRKRLLALGHAGWAPRQLENEIEENSWISVQADDQLIFGTGHENKWRLASEMLGVDPYRLSNAAGHA
ncbi:MAG: YqgE/AlgH family protein [Rickettsiales bacterium]|nr:YqgE/AlgH family protein [Rickettsiales bacterium]